jgi:glycosyltransferase involved in cell wall biosynthesis
MRIAQITSLSIPVSRSTVGGTERVVFYLCEGLQQRGHEVELFASGDSEVSCTLNSVVERATLDNANSTTYLEKEWETESTYNLYHQADRYDLIHAHWPTLAAYFSSQTQVPTLITYHYIESALHRLYSRTFPQCRFACVSSAQHKMLGDDSLPVIYNGVDTDAIPFNSDPEDFFVTAGRMVPNKGIAEAIRIAQKAKKRLVVVGQVSPYIPWSAEYFSTRVKPYLGGELISYIPKLPFPEFIKKVSQAQAFLFPLQWEEPFGLAVVEAMASGTPILTYHKGAMDELIRDGETGYLVTDEEEMIERCGQVDRLDRKKCRNWVLTHFTVSRMVSAYEALYKSILGWA